MTSVCNAINNTIWQPYINGLFDAPIASWFFCILLSGHTFEKKKKKYKKSVNVLACWLSHSENKLFILLRLSIMNNAHTNPISSDWWNYAIAKCECSNFESDEHVYLIKLWNLWKLFVLIHHTHWSNDDSMNVRLKNKNNNIHSYRSLGLSKLPDCKDHFISKDLHRWLGGQ